MNVKAILDDGSWVIIEMQVLNVEGFEKRILYNAAKNYAIQLGEGENYTLPGVCPAYGDRSEKVGNCGHFSAKFEDNSELFDENLREIGTNLPLSQPIHPKSDRLLGPVIALTLTDFVMFDDDRIRHDFKLLEKQGLIEYSDDIALVFFELPKFTKPLADLESLQDRWLYFIKNAGTLDLVPENMEAELAKAFSLVNEAGMSPEELERQHRKRDWIYIQKSSLRLAEKQGLQKGLQEGIREATREIVTKARAVGLPLPVIQEISGLSEQEIRKI